MSVWAQRFLNVVGCGVSLVSLGFAYQANNRFIKLKHDTAMNSEFAQKEEAINVRDYMFLALAGAAQTLPAKRSATKHFVYFIKATFGVAGAFVVYRKLSPYSKLLRDRTERT